MPVANIRMQALAVLRSDSEPVRVADPGAIYRGGATQSLFPSNTSAAFDLTPRYENVAVRRPISTMPIAVLLESELLHEYRELSDALAELRQLDDEDEWKIDAPVYDAARRVASVLMTNGFSAPQILHHGSDSVVFNWTNNANNLYLTISSNNMSALISSPERITRRIEFTSQLLQNPLPAIRYLQSESPEQSLSFTISPTSDVVP